MRNNDVQARFVVEIQYSHIIDLNSLLCSVRYPDNLLVPAILQAVH